MHIGLCLPQLGGNVDRDGLRAFCEQAEELGYGSLWVQEHIFYPLNPVSGYSARPGLKVPDAYRSTLAALETLSAAAAWTARPLVGTSILVAGLHRPVALAQRLSTIDVLSGGRLVAGFSVGWSDEEHQVMDVDPRTRGARCEELVDALEACWGADPVRFAGRFFTIPEAEVKPKPVQRPRPRLLSGMRSPAGLRRTAAKFDIWNPASGTLEHHLEIFGQLNEMRPAGRPPLELYRRLFTTPPVEVANLRTLTVDALCDEIARSRAAGVDAVIIDTNFDPALDSALRWAQVPRTLAPLVAAAGLPAVLVPLPEQVRRDRHGGTERLGPRPLVHAHPVHDRPPPVPAFVPVDITAPPGVELAAAAGGAQQIGDVVNLTPGVGVVHDVDRVVQDAVHGRQVAPVGPDHPCAQVRRGSGEDAVIVGGAVVVGAQHQLKVQPVDPAAVAQRGLPDGLGGGRNVGGRRVGGRRVGGRHLALGGHVEHPADPVVVRRPGRRHPDAQLRVRLEQRALDVPAVGRESPPASAHGDGHGSVAVVGVVRVRVERVPD